MDKEKVFTGVVLEEIKGIAKDNGRNIADANLRLMKIDDDVADVKKEVRSMSEIIADMQGNVNNLIELGREQRQTNRDIGELLAEIMLLQKEVRRDIDTWKEKDREYLKVGAM